MKVYLASRYKYKEKLLMLAHELMIRNYKITSSWLKTKSLKPYDQNIKESRNMAKKIERDVSQSDIFILISDRAGTDMFVELGIAIALNNKIYVVGKYNKRSLMHLHPKIKHVNDVDELLKIIK